MSRLVKHFTNTVSVFCAKLIPQLVSTGSLSHTPFCRKLIEGLGGDHGTGLNSSRLKGSVGHSALNAACSFNYIICAVSYLKLFKCITLLWSQVRAVLVVLFSLFCVNQHNQNKFWIWRFSSFLSRQSTDDPANSAKASRFSFVLSFFWHFLWGINQEMKDDPFVFTEVSNVIKWLTCFWIDAMFSKALSYCWCFYVPDSRDEEPWISDRHFSFRLLFLPFMNS